MRTFLPKLAVAGTTIALLSGLLPLAARAQSQLYGVTFFSNQLFTVDSTTGQGTLLGPLGGMVSAYGLASRGDSLYVFDPNADRLRSIDLSTGMAGAGIDIGVGNLLGEGDLAFRSDGTGFLSSALNPLTFTPSNDLFRFDLATGTSARIGSTSVTMDGLAFDASDVLYGVSALESSLYTIDVNTGATTRVGSLGFDVGNLFGALTFAPDGTLYASLDDRLYTLDKTTGLATQANPDVTSFGFSSVSGLAFASNVIPEPSSILLLGLGMTGFLVVRRRKP